MRLKPMTAYMVERGLLAGGLVAGQLLLSSGAWAGPEGGVVVRGSGTITRVNQYQTHIGQESQNLLMNFDSFDLSVDESVNITQPDASSWFVGNVLSSAPTEIFGSITANGKVALVNPRGVIFGKTARVDAASLFASGLAVDVNELFEGGEVNFESLEGEGGFVLNQGVIQASIGGSVTLLGETVSNEGVIVATLGQVNLASGIRAVVNFGPEQPIGFEVTEEVLENNEGLNAAVSNT
ncbi:MAG: filamentous hemagglutinin N-terminal domain-containing protein, partial [Pseudomonadales bacterium]|nr:filamentous hemagglutinin N-terminal domain-containing protein [Pseudomonadales bacterium]